MKYRMLALILALSVVSWAQTATPTISSPQESGAPAAKGACCEKMAAGDAKDAHACCAHHADAKDMASCCKGKEGASCCDGKDAKSCSKSGKNNCADCGKNETAKVCCGSKCEKDCAGGKCCGAKKADKATAAGI
jgi:hypothetical protein